MTDHDADKLAELATALPVIDLDEQTSLRIAHRARRAIGRGVSATRFVEPIVVALFETTLLVWVVLKVIEVLR